MRYRRSAVLPILGILLIATLLRYYHINHAESLVEQVAATAYAPPSSESEPRAGLFVRGLYPALAGLAHTVGGGVAGVRVFSLLAGLGLVIAVYGTAANLFGHRAGLFSALIVAVSPHAVYQSQLATSASLTVFLCMTTFACHLWAVSTGRTAWRIAYLIAFGALVGTDLSGFLRSGTQTTGLFPHWGPALLLLIGIVCADWARRKECPINRSRVVVGYLIPILLLAPSFAYLLQTELALEPKAFSDQESIHVQTLLEYHLAIGELGNIFLHHLIGHGSMVLRGDRDLGAPLAYGIAGLVVASLAAALGFSVRPRKLGPYAMAVRLRIDRHEWSGLKTIFAFLIGASVFAFVLQAFAHPRPVSFHLLSGASGGLFMIVIGLGLRELTTKVWTSVLFVLPLGMVILFGLRKSYQLFA